MQSGREGVRAQSEGLMTAAQISARYPKNWYAAYHARRYAALLLLLNRYLPKKDSQRILDIGSSKLTELLHEQFQVPVDTLGFSKDGSTVTGYHYCFDLNETLWGESWRTDLPLYDVVVMGEVIEHLYASPILVLEFIKSLIKPGGMLVLQTPNAARLRNRLRLLLGLNPFVHISEDRDYLEHFREYTERELRMYAAEAGFEVVECMLSHYFDYRYVSQKQPTSWETLRGSAVNALFRRLPRNLRTGITLVMTPVTQSPIT